MVLILLEALGALLLLLIVWWTMFSGRKKGELPHQHGDSSARAKPPANGADTTPEPPDRQR